MTLPTTKVEYLDRLGSDLRRVGATERKEIVAEIRSHFEEAAASGVDERAVVQRLGDPRKLALAYQLELARSTADSATEGSLSRIDRWVLLIPIIGALSLPTLIAVAVLGSIALALGVSGVALTGAAFLLAAGIDPEWINWKYPAALAFVAGPAMAMTGYAAGWLLVRYFRLTVNPLRRLLPH